MYYGSALLCADFIVSFKKCVYVCSQLRVHKQEREEEVEDTVARVAEAQVVFSQLNALVGEQQEQVDNIDAQVGAAADGTAQGLKQLRAATTHAKRLNACWIYTCGFGLLSAVVLFLFLLWPSLTGTDDG